MKLAYRYHCSAPSSGMQWLEVERERCTVMWDALVDMDRDLERELHAAIAEQVPPQWQEITINVDGDITVTPAIVAQVPRWQEIERERVALKARLDAKDGDRKALIATLRALRKEQWEIERQWKRDHPEFVDAQTAQRFARIKQIRNASNCYWPNYNSVIARYEAGRQAARKLGRRMRHFDALRDDGMLCVQIQRTRTGLGAAPDELPSLPMLHVGKRPDRGKPLVTVRMRVDMEGHEIETIALMHRPLPACRIKGAQLCWRPYGRHVNWSLVLQCADIEAPKAISYARAGSVAFCWESAPDGGLVVARPSWRDPYVLPAEWMADMDRIERSQQWLDESLKAQIAAASPEVRAKLAVEKLRVRLLRQNDVPLGMREWLRSWKLEWERMYHGRRKHLGRRKDLFRQWAREMVRECPRLAVEAKRLDRIAKQERWTEGNSLRHRACVHELRSEIVHQANKIGAVVFADDHASGKVLTDSGDVKSGVWQRRKAAKLERSQRDQGDIDIAEV